MIEVKKVLLIGVLVLVAGLILIIGGVTFLGEEFKGGHAYNYEDGTVNWIQAHTEANIPTTVAGIVVLVVGGYLIFTAGEISPKKFKGGT